MCTGKKTDLQKTDALGHDIAAGAIDNSIQHLIFSRQHAQQFLIPVLVLVDHAALRAQLDGLINLLLTPTRDPHVGARSPRKLQRTQRHATTNARNQHVLARPQIPVAALDHDGAPRGQTRQRPRRGLGITEMRRRLLDLVRGNHHELLQRAVGVVFRAAQDRVAGLGLGSFQRRLPARAWVHDHALALPFLRGRRAAGRHDGAAAVGEERDAELDARVEVLADEEVAVVEGRGVDLEDDFVGLGRWFGYFLLAEGVLFVLLSVLVGEWRSCERILRIGMGAYVDLSWLAFDFVYRYCFGHRDVASWCVSEVLVLSLEVSSKPGFVFARAAVR
jgi:hypothetical protein